MSSDSEVIIFVKRSLIFLLPLVFFFGISLTILSAAGEMVPIEQIIRDQGDGKAVLFGFAYTNCAKYYKMQSVLKRNPDIIALGTSRVLQFRSKLFKRDELERLFSYEYIRNIDEKEYNEKIVPHLSGIELSYDMFMRNLKLRD